MGFAGTIHVITGSAGATLHTNIYPDRPQIFEYVAVEHGISTLEVEQTERNIYASSYPPTLIETTD